MHNHRPRRAALCLAFCTLMLSGCQSNNTYDPAEVNPQGWFAKRHAVRNPNVIKPAETVFSGNISRSIMDQANTHNTSVIIDIGAQRGYLLVKGQIAASCQVSTAREGKHTPRGTFTITERVRSGKISTIYNVAMPYWMRLNQSPIGLHAGDVPGYPASAGCIRLPYDMARLIYDKTRSGTTVKVYDNWPGGY